MPRYRRPPLTLPELAHDGPPVRVRDLIAITGLAYNTINSDLKCGLLHGTLRKPKKGSSYLIARSEARRYLTQMGVTA